MKGNTKGFTLVELLAAIIIFGVISIYAIPHIVGLLDGSRKKMYVSDAQRMITQVEYKMKAMLILSRKIHWCKIWGIVSGISQTSS